jgi:hypothetical protein
MATHLTPSAPPRPTRALYAVRALSLDIEERAHPSVAALRARGRRAVRSVRLVAVVAALAVAAVPCEIMWRLLRRMGGDRD